MNRERMKQIAADIIREEKSTRKVISTGNVLDNVVSVLDSVMLDRKYMKQSVEGIVSSSVKNPLNAILMMLGLRKIDMDVQFENGGSKLDSMLMLDERVYKSAVSMMASFLADYERKIEKEEEDKVNRINELVATLDEQKRNAGQMKAAADAQFEFIVDWIQDVLGILGKGESDNPLSGQLQELMNDLDIEAYWSAEGTTMHEASMFSEMRVENIGKFREKPCLVCKGEVIAKGIRFRVVETAEGEETPEI